MQAEELMKRILNVIGACLILAGIIFFLQGLNVLQGSFMSDDPQWVVNGGIIILIGIAVLIFARRQAKH